ncbi:lipoprotein LpqN [Mycobacterium tuberculosis]|nr:lipoprotein LpqN [Mycobacterium tuberculosis]
MQVPAGHQRTLGGFSAWQLGGSYSKNGKLRTVAQKTVVIPSQGAVFVLQLNADALDDETMTLMDAANVIDEQTTITP